MTDLFREMNADHAEDGLILGTDGDDVLTSAGPAWGTQTIRGGAGNDQLTSQGGARAVLEGGDGNDVLANEFGEEAILEGGKGDDTLKGGGHRDTFVFNLGDGKDLIQSYSPQYGSMHESTLRFGAGIGQSDLTASQSGNDLLLQHANGQDSIRVQGWFDPQKMDEMKLSQVVFADGTSWSREQLDNMARGLILGTDGDDVLTSAGPAWGTQTIRGGAGNDQLTSQGGARAVLEGGDGNDVLANEFGEEAILEGGKGDDTLKGGGHRDTFVFNLGDGKDLIQSYSPQYGSMHESTLRFGAGIAQSDLTASQSGNDLLLQHANGQDSIRVQGWFDPQKMDEMKLSQVVFADGTSWSREQLDNMARGLILGTDGDDVLTSAGPAWGTQTIRGGAGNDQLTSQGGARAVLEGGDGNDVLANEFGEEAILEGGKGDDTLKGGGHRDTFVFNLGDGKDLIQSYSPQYGSMHESTLRFGAGIAQSDLTASQSGNDLLLQHANGQDSIRVQGWFDLQKMDEMKLSQVVFADGTSWSREQLSQSAGASASQAQALINAMAAFNPPVAGAMMAQPDSQVAQPVLAASSWH